MGYLKRNLINRKATPQNQPIPGSKQVPNSAGGYAFPVDDWKRLDRFLILGSEGGSYYASEPKLTADNAAAVIRCIQADGQRAVKRIVEISDAGRAPKNDPAIFALALASAHGDPETRAAVAEALPQVCRIGTHLFHFAAYVDALRGWGRGLRRAVARWYTESTAEAIAFQAIKYQQRDGWAHRDMLRLAHPVAPTEDHNLVFNWIVKGWSGVGTEPHPVKAAQMIWAFERARSAGATVAGLPEILKLITDYRLPREALPTQFLNEPAVWEAMLPHLGLTAMIRNLGNMSRIGLLTAANAKIVDFVVRTITAEDQLRRARIHPVGVLAALLTYQQGHGVRGSGEWQPVRKIVDALDAAFYLAFGNVQPSGKRMVLALDVSGSMDGGVVAGVPGLTPRIGAATLALVTAAVEKDYQIVGFSHQLVPITISPRQRLDDVVKTMQRIPMGGTDCSLPMIWARENKVQADAFVVITDSETWAGRSHPVQELRRYREETGLPAKLVVVGMVANNFSIADPDDAGMLDVVGFDTNSPALISDFVADKL